MLPLRLPRDPLDRRWWTTTPTEEEWLFRLLQARVPPLPKLYSTVTYFPVLDNYSDVDHYRIVTHIYNSSALVQTTVTTSIEPRLLNPTEDIIEKAVQARKKRDLAEAWLNKSPFDTRVTTHPHHEIYFSLKNFWLPEES